MAKQKRTPFDIELSPERKTAFKNWLIEELQAAINARSRFMADGGLIDTWHGLYEQAERPRNLRKWDDAADLASWIPTEKVDALRARLVAIIFGVDPICVAEGWGVTPEQTAKVEAFHQWKAEDEKLQRWIAKAIGKSLIEGNGILEVTERSVLRKSREERVVQVVTDAFGAPILDEEGKPVPVMEGGAFVDATDPDKASVKATIEAVEDVNSGPQYRVLTLKDFMFLPAHARDTSEIWGYAKRVYTRLPTLKQRAAQGIYDKEAVDRLGDTGDRETRQEMTRQGIDVAPQVGPTAEMELWEVHLLHDIDEDGIEEWLITTVSLVHAELLRVKFDDLKQVQFVDFCPFPNDDSVYGFSYVGHKLWTVTEEHTALRNMKADRTALATSAPIKRLATALWDPDEQPIGAGMVIDVRDMNEVAQMDIKDVPQSVIESERAILIAAERLSGQNDTAVSGVQPQTARTATEHNLAAQASYVRIEEIVHWMQEAIEDLWQLRHVLYRRMLEKQADGVAAPVQVLQGLEARGVEIPDDGPYKFTAADMVGSWRFKPRGSVETADPYRMRSDFAESLQALASIGQTFPKVGEMLGTLPDAWKSVIEQWARLYDMQELAMLLKNAQMAPAASAAPPGLPMPGAPPALPPGLPEWMTGPMQNLLGAGTPPAAEPAPSGGVIPFPGGGAQ